LETGVQKQSRIRRGVGDGVAERRRARITGFRDEMHGVAVSIQRGATVGHGPQRKAQLRGIGFHITGEGPQIDAGSSVHCRHDLGGSRCRRIVRDDQRAGSGARIVQITDRGVDRVNTNVRRRFGGSIVSDIHRIAAWAGSGGRGFRQAIVGLRQVAEHHRGNSLRNHQGAAGTAGIDRIVDGADHHITPNFGRFG